MIELFDSCEGIFPDIAVNVKEFPASTIYPSHIHNHGQFAYAASGVISVFTSLGNWVVPPKRAFWVPAGIEHEMHMRGPVTMWNTFISTDTARGLGLGNTCSVLGVSSLLHELLSEALRPPQTEQRRDKIMELLVQEIAVMPELSLNTPLPQHPRLATLCRQIIEQPSLSISIDTMAANAKMSRRSFTRLFREQTGVSFTVWRQQACLLAALIRLGRGHSITQVAFDLGYGSSSAFTTLFKRVLGVTPSHYFS